ncbi:hypothetical protein [Saccharopolyspora hattusasensis]|uniref:hypothetical protein n=1 Tax=Saccharopolyspora hattusasensis TaxID=1128679 RepID=UPI003D965E63
MIWVMKRGSRRRLPAQKCRWFGEHSEDPTPVTVLVIERPCCHAEDAGHLVPTCTAHLAMVESTGGEASVATPCLVCREVSALRVVSRVAAQR